MRMIAALLLLAAGAAQAAPPSPAAAPYGMIGKITAKPGQRDALAGILVAGTGAMPGNRAYLVAKDAADPNLLWVTESWDSKAAHDASLALPAVRAAITKGRPLIADFVTMAETEPAGR